MAPQHFSEPSYQNEIIGSNKKGFTTNVIL